MDADRQATAAQQSVPAPDESVSQVAEALSAQIGNLSDQFASAFQQLCELEASRKHRMADLEQRETQAVEQAAGLAEREQRLRLSEQELDARQQEFQGQAEVLGTEREQLEQLRAEADAQRSRLDQLQGELQAEIEQLEAQRQELAAQREELAQRGEEFAAQESALRCREGAIAKSQQVFSQGSATFTPSDESCAIPTAPSAVPAAGPLDTATPDQAASSMNDADGAAADAAELGAVEDGTTVSAPQPPTGLDAPVDQDAPPTSSEPQTTGPRASEASEPPADQRPDRAAEQLDAAASEEHAVPPPADTGMTGEEASAERQPGGLFEGRPSPAGGSGDETDAGSDQQPAQQVADADSGSVDTGGLTDEEVEKMRVLRRLGVTLSDAKLIAHIRAERSASLEPTEQDRKRRKSKRRWFR